MNSSGLRQAPRETYPAPWVVARFRELGGALVTAGSDAHRAASFAYGLAHAYRSPRRPASRSWPSAARPATRGPGHGWRSPAGCARRESADPRRAPTRAGAHRGDPRRRHPAGADPAGRRPATLRCHGTPRRRVRRRLPGSTRRPPRAPTSSSTTARALCLDLGQGGVRRARRAARPEHARRRRRQPPAPRPLRGPRRAPPLPALRVRAAAPHAGARARRAWRRGWTGSSAEPGFAAAALDIEDAGRGHDRGRAVPAREPPRHPHRRELRRARHAGRRPGGPRPRLLGRLRARRGPGAAGPPGRHAPGRGGLRPGPGPRGRPPPRRPRGRRAGRRDAPRPGRSSPTSRCAAIRSRRWRRCGPRTTARSRSSKTERPGPSEESERRGPVVRVPAFVRVSGNARWS